MPIASQNCLFMPINLFHKFQDKYSSDADDNLCIPMCKQVSCGLTQAMLDQIIIDEIGNFLISIAG